MSKFCQNCGKELDEAMNFCDGCGAPQQAAPQPAPVAAEPEAPKASFDLNKIIDEVKTFANGLVNRCKADKKFMYTCIGVAAAAVAVLVLLLCLVFGAGGSYTAPIDTLIDVSFEGKFKKLKDLAPEEYWDWYEDKYDADIDDMIEEAEDNFDDMMDYYEEQFGGNIKVSYKIEDKKELSDRKLEGIAEALADKYDINEDKVTAGYELDVEMTIEGSDDEDEDDSEITVIKYNGKWYAVSWYKSGGEYSASFLTGM